MKHDQAEHDQAGPGAVAPTGALTRREALASAARGAAGLFLLLPMFSARAEAAPAQWVVAGKASQFLLGQPQRTALADGSVLYITRLSATTLSAVSAKCTHRGCEVAWDPAGKQLACPCHGAAFASTGKNLHGTRRDPTETLPPLAAVPAAQKKDQVLVNLAALAPPAAPPPPRRPPTPTPPPPAGSPPRTDQPGR